MNKFLILLVLSLSISCKPAYNLNDEKEKIVSLAEGNFSNTDYFDNIPSSLKDSVPKEKLYKYFDSIRHTLESLFFKNEDVISSDIQIEKLSSTRKISPNYFKIIEYSNSLKIKGNTNNIYLKDYKIFLDSELINYSKNDSLILTTTIKRSILTFWEEESKEWKYIPYNDLYNERLFGLKTTQNIIDLYFDDIFIKPKIKWDKESISIFREAYEEDRNEYEEDKIDFEKFLKCRMKYQQKVEEKFGYEIPDEYYDSLHFLEHSIKCRIYSKKLTNNN